MYVQTWIGVSGARDRGKHAHLLWNEGGRRQCATYRLLGQGQRIVEESSHPLGRTPVRHIVLDRAGRQMTGANLGAAPHTLRHAVMTDVARIVLMPQLDLVVRRRGSLTKPDDAPAPLASVALHFGLHRSGEATGRARHCRNLRSATLVFVAVYSGRIGGFSRNASAGDGCPNPRRSV